MRPLVLVVAYARGRVIGAEGGMPWHYPEDLKHFRRVTEGHAIIMGRVTFESIGRALPKRRNLVVTRQAGYLAEGCECFQTFEAALEAAYLTDEAPRVIGGSQLYEAALPLATEVYATEIDASYEGDRFFPALPERFSARSSAALETPGLTAVHYQRRT